MPKPKDIIDFVTARTGKPLAADEEITFGPRQQEVTGVSVSWVVDEPTIVAAAAKGHNCLVHHEALTLPYPVFTFGGPERHYLSWDANYRRLKALASHDMTTIRIHESADELYIFDAFARQLGLGEPIDCDPKKDYSYKVFQSPEPTFARLLSRVKHALNMPLLRATIEDPDRTVSRIGIPWGGLGLFVNVWYVQGLIDIGVDTLICGETDNYGFRFAAECGTAVIETSHEVSEAEGLRLFAQELGPALGVSCEYLQTPCIWKAQ